MTPPFAVKTGDSTVCLPDGTEINLNAPHCRLRLWVLHQVGRCVPLAEVWGGGCCPMALGYEQESGYVLEEVTNGIQN